MEERTCDLCGRNLITEDGFWTCPQYLSLAKKGKKIADEHTSYKAEEGEEEIEISISKAEGK